MLVNYVLLCACWFWVSWRGARAPQWGPLCLLPFPVCSPLLLPSLPTPSFRLTARAGLPTQLSWYPKEKVSPFFECHDQDFDDAALMDYLEEAPLLGLLRRRFAKNNIYTFSSNMVVSVNPYKTIPGVFAFSFPTCLLAFLGGQGTRGAGGGGVAATWCVCVLLQCCAAAWTGEGARARLAVSRRVCRG